MSQPSLATTSLGLPLPPTGRRIHLGEHDGQVRLTCLPRLFFDSIRCWLAVVCLAASIVLGLFWVEGRLGRPAALITLALACGGIVLVAWFYATGRPQTRLTVTRERLRVDVSRTFRARHWECALSQVALIRVHGLRGARGLWIITGDRVGHCLADRDLVELKWVAAVLQRAVGASGGAPPRPVPPRADEVEVTFPIRPGAPPVRGFLLARRHVLALRHDFLETPHHEFFAAPTMNFEVFWRSLCGPALPLLSVDVRCRREESRGVLEIRRDHWPRAELTVWCDDVTALQGAIARFWGAKE